MNDKIVAKIGEMSCASCVRHVEHALQGVEGVHKATVNLAMGTATIVYNAEAVDEEALSDAVTSAGYPWLGFADQDKKKLKNRSLRP